MIRPAVPSLLLTLALFPGALPSQAAQAVQAAQEGDGAPPALTITYLANEGVLIEGGGKRIAIDALHRPYGPPGEYLHLPEAERAKFEAAEPPYEGLDLLLVTHVHRDHFHPEAVGAYLQANPGTTLVSSQQVVESVKEGYGRPEVEPRMREITPALGKVLTRTEVGVPLTLLGLQHGNRRFEWIQNVGYLIEIGGKKILHIGDAAMTAGNFEPFHLPAQKIDIALIPAWFFLYPEGQYAIRKLIAAEQLVAIHVPPNRAAEHLYAIHQAFPEAVVFAETGETLVLE
jgi:L-ascorbate metabolism protein UlaG (beta-lactamase superfamily)